MCRQNERNVTQNPPHLKYYFIAAAVATAMAGIVHLYMPLIDHPRMFNNMPIATFFLGFWICSVILGNSHNKMMGQSLVLR